MALDRARRRNGGVKYDAAIARGTEWVEGLQSRGGGWAAFDADNTCYYLNNIPFADHGALLDPPTDDVTARCVSLLAQLADGGAPTPQLVAAINQLERTQRPEGCWFGRWGVNYVYGTWSVLCALNAAGLDNRTTMVRKATDWLKAVQNPDGGWGEDCDSYRLDYDGHRSFRSTASQTAWALLGLMAAGEGQSREVCRGIEYLLREQAGDGLWHEPWFNAPGFPRVFYLKYHGYTSYFPLWALARFRGCAAKHLA
jgi:squalene-hopene/tetraprenyl-beta-curcumene cyclase